MKECTQVAGVAGQRLCVRMGRALEAVGLACGGGSGWGQRGPFQREGVWAPPSRRRGGCPTAVAAGDLTALSPPLRFRACPS